MKKRGRPKRTWFRRLQERMKTFGVTQDDIGEKIGISGQAVSNRLHGHTPWTLNDMYGVMKLLKIPPDQMYLYFTENGQDADEIQHRYVADYLEETHQSLIATAALDTLTALVESIQSNSCAPRRK